jgi:predicted DNA binding CopG/RHH family protein
MHRDERVTQHQVVIRVPTELREALYERAAAEDRPIARVIRSALRSYLFGEGSTPQVT